MSTVETDWTVVMAELMKKEEGVWTGHLPPMMTMTKKE